MIKEQTRLITLATVLLDLLALLLAFHAAFLLRDRALPLAFPALFPNGLFPLPTYLWMYAVILPAWVGLFFAFRLYAAGRLATFRRLLADLAKANAAGLALVVGVAYLLKLHDISRSFLVLFGLVNLLFIAAGRLLMRAVLHHYRRRGLALRHVLVVGTGPDAADFAHLVARNAS